MNDVKRLRRPPAGGYPRGDETRLRIIEAAIELFGEHGFEGASTRDIAAYAGVNAPALQYYFENKEGVYRACAEHIAAELWVEFEPALSHATAVLSENGDLPALIDAFIVIQAAIADRMFAKHTISPNRRLFFAREQAGQELKIASEVLIQRIKQPLYRLGAELVGRITGTTADDPVTLVRAISLHGQLMPFHIAPCTVLALLGWEEIDAEKGEFLKTTILAQTRFMLEQWSRA